MHPAKPALVFFGLSLAERERMARGLGLARFPFALIESTPECILRADRIYDGGQSPIGRGESLKEVLALAERAGETILHVRRRQPELSVVKSPAPNPLWNALLGVSLARVLAAAAGVDPMVSIEARPVDLIDAFTEALLGFGALEESIAAFDESICVFEMSDGVTETLSVRRVGAGKFKLALLTELVPLAKGLSEADRLRALPEDLRVAIPRLTFRIAPAEDFVSAWRALAEVGAQVVNPKTLCYPTEVLGDSA